ncbi:elongation factor Tu [Angomonas deanei]|uniref:Elongation factor Tu domain 2/Elongation factor Tu C-terminal domain containing protein, putative n=1 Tax=Angomonas deanei TaxID=59799 RepID=A0A7G2CR37_9TRYP|nr:elongation factor Tu [Angomonas deanei]CAD2222286.1 Elongation factor Tu domain 2/Elongation factor Tu C-terminal domain containing protein, putative [Angomonas deanei]|eukprot:EPY39158.1 elongation factor Tu [Angomonas deanei]
MAIEHVHETSGAEKKTVVVTGRVDQGILKANTDAELVGYSAKKSPVKVTGLEMYHKTLDECQPGDSVGVALACAGDTTSLSKDNVERGMVLAAPGSTTVYNKLRAQVYLLTKEEGGRHTGFGPHYRPQLFFHCADITADLSFPKAEAAREELIKKHGKDEEGMKKVQADMKAIEADLICMPGDNVELLVTLAYPMPVEKGLKFTIREGKITVGCGTVIETMGLDNKVSIEGIKKATGKGAAAGGKKKK